MFNLILTIAMMQAAPAPKPLAQSMPCSWPNKCVSAPVAILPGCTWPNRCVSEPVAQVQTCVWPHVCSINS